MKILITGGAGFLGSTIADMLKADNEVVALDNLSAGREKNLDGVRLIKKDIRDIIPEDVAGYEVIIHCAAQVSTFISVDYPELDFENNALGTFKLFEACRKGNPSALILYTSSRSVLGNIPAPKIANEKSKFNPSTFYNVHKIYGEQLCKIYSELYGMRFVIMRPSNVYGVRQPYWKEGWYNFIAFWIKLALENKPIPIFGTGEQIRDYTYVSDTAAAYISAVKNPSAIGGSIFMLNTGIETSLNELARIVIELTGSTGGIKYFPVRKGDVFRFVGSYEQAKKRLGWEPKVGLAEGLSAEIDWCRKEIEEDINA
jgi:UDP-glucose 4-epimerase